ncbi:MAG TPA: PilZ domain-containing protein [Luteimonas sp.]
MDDFSNPLSVEEQRRHRRRPVLWKGQVEVSTHRLECRVLNITAGGLLAELDLPLASGVAVRVLLPNVRPLSAEVRWYADGLHGLSFSEPPEQIKAAFGSRASVLGLSDPKGDRS